MNPQTAGGRGVSLQELNTQMARWGICKLGVTL